MKKSKAQHSAQHHALQTSFNFHRLDALVDGVLAVAMTLLVLEIKVPDLPSSANAADLITHLKDQGSLLMAFLFSFYTLAVAWNHHRRMTHELRSFDRTLMVLSFFFLATACLMPHVTALFARYMTLQPTPVIYFSVCALLWTNLAFQWSWAHRRGMLEETGSSEMYRRYSRENWISALAMIALTLMFSFVKLI